jgi:hypothetical protein
MSSKIALASALMTASLLTVSLPAAEKYDGPIPPKPDIPYLLHASSLISTEVADARQEGKNDDKFVISGESSPARTPLAEPIFIIDARQIQPQSFELYRLEVKHGNREVEIGSSRRGSQPLHLAVRPLGGHLYRVEADQPLEDGEYVLSPNGDNRSFCFEIY